MRRRHKQIGPAPVAQPRYGWGLVGLHWLTLILIVAACGLAWWLDTLPLSPTKLKLYAWHKWMGLLVLALLPVRIALRCCDPLPRESELAPWEARLSAVVHGLLYACLLAAPLLGWLHSSAAGFPVVLFGVLPLPDLLGKDADLAALLKVGHEVAVYFMVSLVAIHALGALYHRHVQHDGVFQRMAPWMR